jgi:hypothetical protein
MMTQFDDLLVDPPIVDTLRVDDETGSFVLTFIPTDGLSAEQKLAVTIPVASAEGRQILNWLNEFRRLLSVPASVVHIVHSGGGDFAIGFSDGTSQQLSDPDLDNGLTLRVYDGLKYVSQAAENAYRIVRVNLTPTP